MGSGFRFLLSAQPWPCALPCRRLELDFDVDARRQLQPHQPVHCLRRRLQDVDQALVRADLELPRESLSMCGESER